jgi:hypothetical protein
LFLLRHVIIFDFDSANTIVDISVPGRIYYKQDALRYPSCSLLVGVAAVGNPFTSYFRSISEVLSSGSVMIPTLTILTLLILTSTKLRIDVAGTSEISGALMLERLSYSCFVSCLFSCSLKGSSFSYFSSSVIFVISAPFEMI